MAAATARAPAADKRWGSAAAAAAAAAPTRTPAVVGAPGTAPRPTNLSTQWGTFPWGDRPMPPAPNAWDSSSLLSLKNDGGSGSFGSINDRPSSRGSSSTSTDGSDLLDSPLAWGRTSHNSTTAISHPESTELRSGSWQFSRSQTSFSDVLKAPLRTIGKRRSTSQGKGFTLSADEFPVLVTKNSQSNSQLGHSFQGRPTFSSVIMAAQDEQRKIPITGGDPVSTTNFSMEGQQAQLHATQTPDICMPPPCIDYWHPPPDHPPDRNGIWQGGAASYGSCKPADTPGSFSAESFTHNGQSLLNQGGEARHGPVHGVYHPQNNGSCYAHMPADACIRSLPHLLLGKIKDNHSGALEKQVIKKDVALLEKIKCLNIKARNLRAGNISEISSCRESKVEHPKSIDVEAYHVANDAPVCAVISDITSAFDMANSVSASSNHMPIGTSNVSASANLVMIDLSEGHATKFSEARKPSESADNHVYGVGNTSRNKRGSSATNTASDIWGPGWEEHSTVDSLPVAMTNTHEDQPFAGNSSQQVHVGTADDMLNKRGSSATNTASDIWGPGYEEHSAVDSLPVAMTYTREDQPFAGNSSQQVHVRTADDMLNSPDYEIQNSMRELSAQHAKQLQEEERGEIGQKAKSIVKLEDLHRHPFVQSQESNDAPGKSAEYHAYRGGNASRNGHGSSEDISSSISGHEWEDHPRVDSFSVVMTNQDLSFSGNTSQQVQHSRRELSAQHARQLQEEERRKSQQKVKSIARLEDMNIHPLVQSQKSNDAPGKSTDSHEYGGWNASRNKHSGSAEDISFNISEHGWEDHPTVDSLPVMINSHQGKSVPWDTSQQLHARTTDDRRNSPGHEIEHSRWRESSVQHAKELRKEREIIQQKTTSTAKLEGLNIHPFVRSQKSNDAPRKSANYHEYGGWHASRNRHGSSAEDISFNMPGRGWEDYPTVDSLPVMRNTHQNQSFPRNTSRQVHARTADMLNSPGYEIQHSRRELSVQHANRLPEQERGNIQQKAKSIAKLEDLNRSRFVRSQKSDDAPGKSADYYVYGGGNASRNRHDSSAEDISFKICVLGWDDHPTVDSLPVMTNTHQGQSFSGNTAEQLSRRELSAQHARQLQKEEGEKLQQKAKANAKLEELNRSSFVQNHKSNNVPLEADKVVHKQSAGGSGTTNYDTSTSDTYCTAYVENLNAPLRANGTKNTAVPISSMPTPDTAGVDRGPLTHNVMPSAKKTDINMLEHTAQKSAAWSHDSSASKHLQVEDREGQVHKQDSMPWISTPASDTADANKGPLMHNVIPSAKNTDVNMIHIGQKGASESHDSTAPMHLQMEDKRRQVHSQGRILRGPPVSESAGVSKGSLIHNVMLSAKNSGINMTEHIARKSASESHENSAPKHLQMGNRRWQVRSQERVLRERSNIAESTENITTVAGTLVDTQNAEAKPHMGLSTQSKNRRPASPHVFGTENTEASSVHKTHTSGVVINSAIIPVQVSSVRGFTVGSIMLGNASLASVNQEEKTVAKEVHDDITNSCASPKRIKQSGTNQCGVQHVKDPHGSDSIMHTPVKEPSKKEQSEAGGLNCTAIPAPTQPSGNQSIVSQDVVPAKTNEMERHAHKPAYKELHLQNLRQMVPAENHTTSFDNSSTSKLDTKSLDKEALDAPTATKAEVKTVPENWEDAKTSKHTATKAEVKTEPEKSEDEKTNKHVQRSRAALNQDLSDQLEQVEKQLESSTNVATVNHSQPPQMVSRPGYTWGEHQASRNQRQYHVDGQGNVWTNSYIDGSGMAMGAVLPTTHYLLPAPGHISVPQNNALNSSSTPGWAWDTAERVLISDMGDAQGLGAAITARSDAEPNQIVFRVGQTDVMHGAQAMGGMSFGAAASVGGSNHAGLELQQLNPAWFPHGQHDGGYNHGGMGMYFLGMDHGAGAQSHSHADYDVAGPMVGALGPDYQLVPLAPLPEAWVAAYGEHLYYV